MKRSDITGSVVSVKAEDMQQPAGRPEPQRRGEHRDSEGCLGHSHLWCTGCQRCHHRQHEERLRRLPTQNQRQGPGGLGHAATETRRDGPAPVCRVGPRSQSAAHHTQAERHVCQPCHTGRRCRLAGRTLSHRSATGIQHQRAWRRQGCQLQRIGRLLLAGGYHHQQRLQATHPARRRRRESL